MTLERGRVKVQVNRIQRPASNQRWCSDVFLISCWSGEVLSVAFAIDCHDREVLAYLASPRSLTGAHIRTLIGPSGRGLARRRSRPRMPFNEDRAYLP